MVSRAEPSGRRLTDSDASIVKGMLARGDRQHDVAAYFGVNGGRIAEISTGERFGHVLIQSEDLPPPGPYLSPVSVDEALSRIDELAKFLGRKS